MNQLPTDLSTEERVMVDRTMHQLVTGARVPEDLRARIRFLSTPDEFDNTPTARDLRTCELLEGVLEEWLTSVRYVVRDTRQRATLGGDQ